MVTSSDEEEPAQEKKLRLAKEYLANLEQEGMYDFVLVHYMYIIRKGTITGR